MPTTARKRLDSWKEIADYLGRDVRTAMRWEEDGLPVRSVPGGQRRGVFAFGDEIDEWLAARGKKRAEAQTDVAADANGSLTVEAVGPATLRKYVLAVVTVFAVVAAVVGVWFTSHRNGQDLIFHLSGQTFRFERVATIPLQGQIGSMAAADFNHDGWTDLVVGGFPTSRFAVLINRDGTFGAPAYYEGCESSIGPAVGDFDADGNPDIAIACNRGREVQVWWGDGKGGFHSPVTMPGAIDPIRCVAADLNHDGISDFIVDASGGGPMIVYLAHRDRTFTLNTYEAGSNPHTPTIADVDGDGNLDIVAACFSTGCRNLSLLRGNGDGTFKPAEQLATVGAAWTVFVTDLTGDGVPDVFTESISGEASIFPGLGEGKFLPARFVSRPLSAATANLFKDQGHTYVFEMQLYPYDLRLLSFDRQGNAEISNSVRMLDTARYATQGDYNHDGRNELAILFMRKSESYVSIYMRK